MEALALWWDANFGGTLPTQTRLLELVMQNSVDPGTGAFVLMRLKEIEGGTP